MPKPVGQNMERAGEVVHGAYVQRLLVLPGKEKHEWWLFTLQHLTTRMEPVSGNYARDWLTEHNATEALDRYFPVEFAAE